MKFKNGLMLILTMFSIALGGYVSAEPQTKPPLGQNTNVNFIIGNEVNAATVVPGANFLAQADVPADYVDQTKADSIGHAVIDNVTAIVPAIKVDTVENLNDIVESGTYLVKSVHKGMNWQEILALIFGILGLAAGLYYFFRHKKLKDVAAAAGIKV